MNIYLDIETIPGQGDCKAEVAKSVKHPATLKKKESITDWYQGKGKYVGVKAAAIEEAWRKTALDGTQGEVISIFFCSDRFGEDNELPGHYRDVEGCEKDLLSRVFEMIALECDGRPPYFIGHNIRFDLKFLYQRAVILGLKPPFQLPFRGRHHSDFFCTMEGWAGHGQRISQDNLCKALGIEGKPDDIDGSKVWDFVKAGEVKRVAEYNMDDVTKVRHIYNRLTFN